MIDLIRQYYMEERHAGIAAVVAAIIFLVLGLLLITKYYGNKLGLTDYSKMPHMRGQNK